jgi:hypothetical protein
MSDSKEKKNHRISLFFKGFSSVFDISGQSFIQIPDLNHGPERDRDALRGDWYRVGGDIRSAMNKVLYEQ